MAEKENRSTNTDSTYEEEHEGDGGGEEDFESPEDALPSPSRTQSHPTPAEPSQADVLKYLLETVKQQGEILQRLMERQAPSRPDPSPSLAHNQLLPHAPAPHQSMTSHPSVSHFSMLSHLPIHQPVLPNPSPFHPPIRPHSPVHLAPTAPPTGRSRHYRPVEAPKFPDFTREDEVQYKMLRMALNNLLDPDETEEFKFHILLDHLKVDQARRLALAYSYSQQPFTEALRALDDRYGQPRQWHSRS